MSDQMIPKFLIPVDGAAIHITIPATDALVSNPGITFNGPGVTFNDPRYTFGGVYNQNEDVVPILDVAYQEIPHIFTISDIGIQNVTPVPPNNQAVQGPGFWLLVGQ